MNQPLLMFENPTTVFSCDDIFWASYLYARPLHSLFHFTGAWGDFSTLECSAPALPLVLKAFLHSTPKEQLFSRQARHKPLHPKSVSPPTWDFYGLVFFSASSNFQLLNWDIRKPGRRWGNGGGHNNSLHLVEVLPYGKDCHMVKETLQVIKIWFWM